MQAGMICRGVIGAVLLAASTVGTLAMPLSNGADALTAPRFVEQVQYGPGHYRTKQYRRALRRYRGHPGAQFELRQNRRIYCRNTPERC